MPHRDLRFSHDYVEDAPPIVPVQGAVSGKAGGPVTDHSHTASGDGGTFDAANLRSDQDAEDGAVLSSDGEEGSEWRTLTLGSLSDVNAPDPDDGDVPTWDDSAGEWVASPPAGGAMALDDLTDVDAAAPDDEDVLTWDDVAGKWVAAPPAGGAVDAGDVTYTPTTAADWDSSADPGNADDAFDQLAERVKDIEDAGGAGSPDASAVTYTPTTATDWDSDADPGNVDDALDQLAERVDDLEGAGGGGSVATDAIWDAKGDLAGGTGANTAARLAVGTNGYVLSADSGETTGLKWVPGYALLESRQGRIIEPLSGTTLTQREAMWVRFVALANVTITRVRAAVTQASDDIRCRVVRVAGAYGNTTLAEVIEETSFQAVSPPEFADFTGLSAALTADNAYAVIIEIKSGSTLIVCHDESQTGLGSLLPNPTPTGGYCARNVAVSGAMTAYASSLPIMWITYSL